MLQTNIKNTNKNQEDMKTYLLLESSMNFEFVNNMYKSLKNDKRYFKKLNKYAEELIVSFTDQDSVKDNSSNNDMFTGLFYVLGKEMGGSCHIFNAYQNNPKDLKKWLKDKEFRLFYKKTIIALLIVSEERESIFLSDEELRLRTNLLGTNTSILFTYFLNVEKNITVEKVKSFFSKVFDWSVTSVDFHVPLNEEQERIMEEIKTGIKYKKLKKEPSRNNESYTKSDKFNVTDFLKNNIKIKYVSAKEYKHIHHKSPIQHMRTGHWRHYSSGKKVWIETMIIGCKEAV